MFCNCSVERYGGYCQHTYEQSWGASDLPCTTQSTSGIPKPKCVNGICVNNTCYCHMGFRGHQCEIGIRVIMPLDIYKLCQNGGTWYVQSGHDGCMCPCGFSGERCDKQIGSLTCKNGGTFNTTLENPKCECPCYFFGDYCQYSTLEYRTDYMDRCSYGYCFNGGTCYINTGMCESKCRCPYGYTGRQCNTSIVTTSRRPNRVTPDTYSEISESRDRFPEGGLFIALGAIFAIIISCLCCYCCFAKKDGQFLPRPTCFVGSMEPVSTSQAYQSPQPMFIDVSQQQSTFSTPYGPQPTTAHVSWSPQLVDARYAVTQEKPPSYEETCGAPLPTYNEAIGHI